MKTYYHVYFVAFEFANVDKGRNIQGDRLIETAKPVETGEEWEELRISVRSSIAFPCQTILMKSVNRL